MPQGSRERITSDLFHVATDVHRRCSKASLGSFGCVVADCLLCDSYSARCCSDTQGRIEGGKMLN